MKTISAAPATRTPESVSPEVRSSIYTISSGVTNAIAATLAGTVEIGSEAIVTVAKHVPNIAENTGKVAKYTAKSIYGLLKGLAA